MTRLGPKAPRFSGNGDIDGPSTSDGMPCGLEESGDQRRLVILSDRGDLDPLLVVLFLHGPLLPRVSRLDAQSPFCRRARLTRPDDRGAMRPAGAAGRRVRFRLATRAARRGVRPRSARRRAAGSPRRSTPAPRSARGARLRDVHARAVRRDRPTPRGAALPTGAGSSRRGTPRSCRTPPSSRDAWPSSPKPVTSVAAWTSNPSIASAAGRLSCVMTSRPPPPPPSASSAWKPRRALRGRACRSARRAPSRRCRAASSARARRPAARRRSS